MTLVIDTGTTNLASMMAALRRLDLEPEPVTQADGIADATRVVLPGVGAFGAGMRRLDERGFSDPLRARIAAGRPLLAVCLGLQLLCETSTESPGVTGLGVLPVPVERFATAAIVPQLGWNHVAPSPECALLRDGYAYFANSYRLTRAPAGWHAAFTTHGERFVAAVERGPILATQFHPELSGAWGHDLLAAWGAAT
ncbi:MAG: imidazole glycerol phosphate synthase subunit HisH [Myxococcota bacterium]